MDILSRVENTAEFGRKTLALNYGPKIPAMKINRALFQHVVEKAHLRGKINLCAALVASHQNNPYSSVDELLGDIQIILTDSWKLYKKFEPKNADISLEDLVNKNTLQIIQGSNGQIVCKQ